MAGYVYDGETNEPMNAAAIETHGPCIKDGRMIIVDHDDVLPFNEPPRRCCWTCWEYDGNRCHLNWNNDDECYYVPERDNKKPSDVCDKWEFVGEEAYNNLG